MDSLPIDSRRTGSRLRGNRLMGSRLMGSRRRTIAAAAATVLTSAGLYPIFAGGAWFWADVGAVVTVAAFGALTRLRWLPVTVCLLGGLAGLLLYLNLVFAHSLSLIGVLPTPSSLRYLWALTGQGISESSRYAPPVPELSGMLALAAGGVGLTALLVDLIAVRLGSAALAGLPLLLLFTEPFTLSISPGWLGTATVFCLATAGYLTLLGTEGRERIRQWEQPRAGWAEDRAADGLSEVSSPDTHSLAAAGRRVGVASAVVALCVPLFVPGLHVTRLFGGGHPGIGGFGNGSGNLGFPDPQTQLSGELRSTSNTPLLSYMSTSADPGYLQVYVLGDLTGHGWQFSRPQSLVPAGGTVPAPPGLEAGTAKQLVTTHAAVSKQAAQDPFGALPAPYPPVRVNADGTLQADRSTLMLFDSGLQLAGLNYSVTSLDVNPSEGALKSAGPSPKSITDRYLDVPQSYASLRTLATSITASATTRYAKAVALQNWFADGNFGYSLSAPTVTNAAGLKNFVKSTHAGYCQQFSFAMAVLARLLGIPSRVVYGFTQGTRQHNGSWLVTTHDAHAWPELYFQGYGWLRFEPTPAGTNGQGTATTPAYTTPQVGPVAPASSAPLPNPAGTAGKATGSGANQSALNRGRQFSDDGSGDTALPASPPGGPNPWQLAVLSVLGLLVVAAALPGCARTAIRRRRWQRADALAGKAHADTAHADTAHADTDRVLADRALADRALADAAWRELRDDLTDHRAGYRPSESPRALAHRVSEELKLSPDAADALRRVTMAAERAVYSARPASGATLRHDSATVRRAVAASVPRRARWLARVFPSSVVTPVVFIFGQVTDVFGRLGFSRVKIGANRPHGRTVT